MFNDSKYTKWYYTIIAGAKVRAEGDGYGERHHIIPKSLGGDNRECNLVRLSAREHFICHWLLTKMVTGTTHKYKMWNAFSCMLYMENPDQTRYQINARTFAAIKERGAIIKSIKWSGEGNPMHGRRGEMSPSYGKPKSDEQKLKQRLAQLGVARPHVRGRKQTPEQIAKRVAARHATLIRRKAQGI